MARATPIVPQLGAAECGAACLASVLCHYGRWVTLEEMRDACGVSRNGSRAGNIVRAARRAGLRAEGYRVPAEQARALAEECYSWRSVGATYLDLIRPPHR